MLKKVFFITLISCLPWIASPVWAEEAQDVLKKEIDVFVSILKDPKYKDPARKEEQVKQIWPVINRVIDFEGVAVRAVGNNWRKFSDTEKKDFVSLFKEMLGLSYLGQLQDKYAGESAVYLGQEKDGPDRATVKTKIVRSGGTDIPVDYIMWTRNGTWQVYDIKVEGVSLIQNYRSQFNDVLLNNPPSALIDRLKKKVADLKAGKPEGGA